MIRLENVFGCSPVTLVVHTSTSAPLVNEVILMLSTSYKVGGDLKELIWNFTIWPEAITPVNNDDATTVIAELLPVHTTPDWALDSPVQLMEVSMGYLTSEISLVQNSLGPKASLIEEEAFSWLSSVT